MKQSKPATVLTYALLIGFGAYFLAPFLWMLLTALKTEAEAYAFPPKIFPAAFRVRNFLDAWNSQPFGTFLKNSLVVTALTTVGQLISCSLVAYGFARYDFKAKNVLFVVLLSTMMIPWDVIVIPLYMEFKALGWINTLKPLIVPAFFGSAYYIFLLKQFLMSIPKDFEDAARIDGAGELQTFAFIFVPMMKAPLVLVGVLNVMSAWNDYLGPLVFLNSRDKYTLPLGLAAFKGAHELQIIPIMAITTLMIIIPIAAFAYAQKYIIEGMSGALKG